MSLDGDEGFLGLALALLLLGLALRVGSTDFEVVEADAESIFEPVLHRAGLPAGLRQVFGHFVHEGLGEVVGVAHDARKAGFHLALRLGLASAAMLGDGLGARATVRFGCKCGCQVDVFHFTVAQSERDWFVAGLTGGFRDGVQRHFQASICVGRGHRVERGGLHCLEHGQSREHCG